MSRAFVREIDDAPPPPLPERPVSSAPNLVTPNGARLIRNAVSRLEKEIAAAPDDQAAALRRDLRYWVARRASMRIVPPDPAPGAVGFGVRATIRRGTVTSELSIVGEDEADPSSGRIAWTAPLARALDGAEPGDVVDLEVGGRVEPMTVIAVAAEGSGE